MSNEEEMKIIIEADEAKQVSVEELGEYVVLDVAGSRAVLTEAKTHDLKNGLHLLLGKLDEDEDDLLDEIG